MNKQTSQYNCILISYSHTILILPLYIFWLIECVVNVTTHWEHAMKMLAKSTRGSQHKQIIRGVQDGIPCRPSLAGRRSTQPLCFQPIKAIKTSSNTLHVQSWFVLMPLHVQLYELFSMVLSAKKKNQEFCWHITCPMMNCSDALTCSIMNLFTPGLFSRHNTFNHVVLLLPMFSNITHLNK